MDSLLSDLEDAEVVAGTVVGCVLAAEEGAVVEAEAAPEAFVAPAVVGAAVSIVEPWGCEPKRPLL